MRRVRLLSTGHVAGLGAGDVLGEDDPRFEALVRLYWHSVEEVEEEADGDGPQQGDGRGPEGDGADATSRVPTHGSAMRGSTASGAGSATNDNHEVSDEHTAE